MDSLGERHWLTEMGRIRVIVGKQTSFSHSSRTAHRLGLGNEDDDGVGMPEGASRMSGMPKRSPHASH